MSKLTPHEKIQAAKRYLEGKESQDTVAQSVGISKAILQTWIRQYQLQGEDSFKKGYTAYPAEYKLMVLSYITEHGTSLREAAAIFNIPTHSILSRWKKEFEIKGEDALKSMKMGRPSMKKDNKPTFGSKVSLSRSSIANIENGIQKVTIQSLYQISYVLKISIYDLLPENRH